MQKLHMQFAGVLCSACVQSAAPPAELAPARFAAPFAPVAEAVPVAVAPTALAVPSAAAGTFIATDAAASPDAGQTLATLEPPQPEPQREVWPAPPLTSDVCAERTLLLHEGTAQL